MTLPAHFIPPLENGDCLTRLEFEQRYEAMPQVKKAELVEGIVYMASPLRFESHGKPHSAMMTWLGTYWAATPGTLLGDNTTVRFDKDNEHQPDAVLFLPSTIGGKVIITEDDYLQGAPELIVEIAASTASYDFHIKRRVYERQGVQEYIVWRVYDQQIDWFQLQPAGYVKISPNESGLISSQVFPGLVLAVSALLAGKYAQVLAELQQGLQSPEHQNFVKQLQEKAGNKSNYSHLK
ncbi:MAG: Uma2 family endonuclease [Thioploca sp.]|nr:Uma2 family endonuclease [Thioploca sp.]